MAVKEPKSMDELVYHTIRDLSDEKGVFNGEVTAWAYRGMCPKCKKGLMGKPVEKGKVKIRSTEFVCPECKYTVEKEEYEGTLMLQAKYKCPNCGFKGEVEAPFKRKKVAIFDIEKQKKVSIPSVRFVCGKCGKNIDVTQKMK